MAANQVEAVWYWAMAGFGSVLTFVFAGLLLWACLRVRYPKQGDDVGLRLMAAGLFACGAVAWPFVVAYWLKLGADAWWR